MPDQALYDKYFGGAAAPAGTSPIPTVAAATDTPASGDLYAKYFGAPANKQVAPAPAQPALPVGQNGPRVSLLQQSKQQDYGISAPTGPATHGATAETFATVKETFTNTVKQLNDAGAAADVARRAAIDTYNDPSKSMADVAASYIKYGIAGFNMLAAPFTAAQNVAEAVPATKKAAETVTKASGWLNKIGGTLAGAALDVSPMSPQAKASLRPAVQDLGGLAANLYAFEQLHAGATEAHGPPETKVTQAAMKTLGVTTEAPPDLETVKKLYTDAVAKIAEQGGPHVEDATQMATTAFHALQDRATMAPEDYAAKWGTMATHIDQTMPTIVDQFKTTLDGQKDAHDAATGIEARNVPVADGSATKAYRALNETGKLAYEQDSQSNFNQAVNKAKEANPQIPDVKVTDVFDAKDPSAPGTFDPETGEVTVNYSAIMDLADKAERGESLLIGKGKYQYVLEAKPGETRGELEARITADIVKHEYAHFQTVTPEDAALLKAARETGDQKAYDAKVLELEDKANHIMRTADHISGDTQDAINREVSRVQEIIAARSRMKEMKFDNTDQENGYRRYAEAVKRNPDLAGLDYEGLRDKLNGKTGYADAGSIERRFGLTTAIDLTHDQLLDKYRARFEEAGRTYDVAKQKIQSELFDKLKGDDKAKAREVQAIVRETLDTMVKELKDKADRQRERAVAKERSRGERNLNKQETKFNAASEKQRLDAKAEGIKSKLDTAIQKDQMMNRGRKAVDAATGRLLNEQDWKMEKQKQVLESKAFKDRLKERFQTDAIIQKIRDKATSGFEARRAIVKYYRDNVPREFKGDVAKRILSDVKNATSRTDLEAAFRKIATEYNKAERKTLVSNLKEDLKAATELRKVRGIRQAKFGDQQPLLDQLRKTAETMDRGTAYQKIVENTKKYSAEAGYPSIPDDVVIQNQILETAGMDQQTNSQLKNTLSILHQIMEKGRTDQADHMAVKAAVRLENLEGMREDLTGSKEKLNETQPDVKTMQKGNALIEFPKSVLAESSTLGSLTKRLSARMYDLFKTTAEGVTREAKTFNDESMALVQKIADAYGKEADVERTKFLKDQTDFGMMKGTPDAEGKSADIHVQTTRGLALDLYMKLKDPYMKDRLTNAGGNAYTPEIIEKMLSVLTPEDKAIGDHIIKGIYAKWFEPLSKAVQGMRGSPLAPREGFAGVARYAELGPNETDVVQNMMHTDEAARASQTPGSARSRSGFMGKIQLSNDPVMDSLNYIRQVNHFIEMGDQVQQWNQVVNDQTIMRAIEKQRGKAFTQTFKYQVENVTRGSLAPLTQMSQKLMQDLGQNLTNSLLANTPTLAGHFSAIFQFRAYAENGGSFWKGVAKAFAKDSELDTHVPMLETMNFKTPNELRDTIGNPTTNDVAKFFQKVREADHAPLQAIVSAMTRMGASGLFEDRIAKYVKEGHELTEAKALAGRDVNALIYDIQPTKSYLGKSQIQTDGNLTLFSQLRDKPMKISQAGLDAIDMARNGHMTKAEAAGFLYWNNVVQPVANSVLRTMAHTATFAALAGAAKGLGYDKAAKDYAQKAGDYFGKTVPASLVGIGEGFLGTTSLLGESLVNGVANVVLHQNGTVQPGLVAGVLAEIGNIATDAAAGKWTDAALRGFTIGAHTAGIADMGLIDMIRQGIAANAPRKVSAPKKKNKPISF